MDPEGGSLYPREMLVKIGMDGRISSIRCFWLHAHHGGVHMTGPWTKSQAKMPFTFWMIVNMHTLKGQGRAKQIDHEYSHDLRPWPFIHLNVLHARSKLARGPFLHARDLWLGRLLYSFFHLKTNVGCAFEQWPSVTLPNYLIALC
eukprot:scaffold258700_cov17-Tisochrysis_lutea.AAC.3